MTQSYAGRSHDEWVAARTGQEQRAQEQAGGEMAMEGTEADAQHSCGVLSAQGRQVWHRGSGIDGGGMVPAEVPAHRPSLSIVRRVSLLWRRSVPAAAA
ncbi:hypothetical protein C7405_101365 [Paraburkholderia caballeronis]|uniref:hypothetical protein n=1 Tax=Paraburkholderia caballeronis TaxID=416943 RepID=UPI0010D9433D|nr:hypothetical protein C7405_101365 [Paraburkholderia caballeronis]